MKTPLQKDRTVPVLAHPFSRISYHDPAPARIADLSPHPPMNDHVQNLPDRREFLQGGLFLAVTSFLAGCAGTRTSLPDPVWPGDPTDTSRPSNIAANPPRYQASPVAALPPEVIPRSRWTSEGIVAGRLTANGNGGLMNGISRITVHHDALDSGSIRSTGDAIRRLNQVRTAHITRRPEPFADIGYHYIIDPQGRIWEGRPIRYQGAHVKGQNEHNLGIVLMGHFDRQSPTPAALDSLERFVVWAMHHYNIPLSRVKTHQEMAPTECPGRNLQRYMVRARSGGGALYRAG
jgi:hypothetical protein